MSFDDTFIGYATHPEDDRTARAKFPRPEDRTSVETFREDRPKSDVRAVMRREDTDRTMFTQDMLDELRTKLREAEAREASGVRPTPTPPAPTLRAAIAPPAYDAHEVDPLDDLELDIEIDEPKTFAELEQVLTTLPELEVALAPQSDSNFYAGFDESHPTGLFFATYGTMEVGEPVYLDVYMPAGYRFRTPAVVEGVRPPEAAEPGLPAGIGFQLCGLDTRMRRLIRTFARHRKPMFYVG